MRTKFRKANVIWGAIIAISMPIGIAVSCSNVATETKHAALIPVLSNFIPTLDGEISSTVDGWNIDLVDEKYSPLTSLNHNQTYILKFTLQSGYTVSSNFDQLTVSVDDINIYYSNVLTFEYMTASNLPEDDFLFENYFALDNGKVIIASDSIGWDVDIVNENYQLLTSLSNDVNYRLRFTLQNGYIASANLNSVIVDADNQNVYYSEIVSFSIIDASPLPSVETLLSDYKIKSNGEVILPSDSIGWNVSILDSNYQLANSFIDQSSIFYLFSLKNGYQSLSTSSDFFNFDGDLRSGELRYQKAANLFSEAGLNFDSNIFSFSETTGEVSINEYLAKTTGFSFEIVDAEMNVKLNTITENLLYKYKAKLNEDYQLPDIDGAFTYDKETKSYLTDVRTYLKSNSKLSQLTDSANAINWKAFAFNTDSNSIESALVLNDSNNAFVGIDTKINSIDNSVKKTLTFSSKSNYVSDIENQASYENFENAEYIDSEARYTILTYQTNFKFYKLESNPNRNAFNPTGWKIEFSKTLSHTSQAESRARFGTYYYVRFRLISKFLIREFDKYSLDNWDINFAQIDDINTETTFIWKNPIKGE